MSRPSVFIRLVMTDGSHKDLRNIERMTFTKDYYQPCSKLTAKVVLEEGQSVYSFSVKRVELYVRGSRIHNGLPDVIKTKQQGNLTELWITSRGVSVTLCQTEPEPGIWTNVCLRDVVQNGRKTSEITYESGTDTISYVNIPERSNAWEAVCLYALKAYATYPYISSSAKIMVTKSTDVIQNPSPVIMSVERQLDTRQILSDLYMQDVSGEYNYYAENTAFSSYNLTRERYYPLDQSWLHDEEEGLRLKLLYSLRGSKAYSLTYEGYCGEDITDRVNFTGIGSLSTNLRVGALKIELSSLGVFTTVTQYYDGFM